MAEYRWSKLSYLLSLLVAITVFSGGDATTVKSRVATLNTNFKMLKMFTNTARWKYYDNRIAPAPRPSVIQNITTSVYLNGSETAEVILRRFIREVDRFRNPIYLAYFDEHARADTNTGLSTELSKVSSTLNNTYYCAVGSVFPRIVGGKRPSENHSWTRVHMEKIIKAQNISRWPAFTLHELRTYATLRELKNTQRQLTKLLSQLEKLV